MTEQVDPGLCRGEHTKGVPLAAHGVPDEGTIRAQLVAAKQATPEGQAAKLAEAQQTDRLCFTFQTIHNTLLRCFAPRQGCTNVLSSRAPAAHTPRQHERLGVLHTHHPTYLREAWLRRTTKRQ